MPVESPRLKRCRCGAAGSGTFSPLSDLFSSHVAPEMLYLEAKWASLVSFDATVGLLKDVLPVGAGLNAETVRNHLHRVANRMEGELGRSGTDSSRARQGTMPRCRLPKVRLSSELMEAMYAPARGTMTDG